MMITRKVRGASGRDSATLVIVRPFAFGGG